MRRLPRWIIATAMTLGCTPADDAMSSEASGDSGGAPILAPMFVEPASGTLAVSSTRVTDVVLEVANVDPGRTDLVIDGLTLGTVGPDSAVGELSAETLSLRLRGALIPGPHRLLLRTVDGTTALASEEIAIVVEPVAAPALTVTLGSPRIDGRIVTGFGSTVLAALDDRDLDEAPRLTIVRAVAGDWDWDGARTVFMPGYVRDPLERGLAVAVDVVYGSDGTPLRLRVAWRRGAPGSAIELLDAGWDDADLESLSSTALQLTPDLTGPVEYAEYRRPHLFGDTLLAELLAASDVEQTRPGDLALIAARLRGVPAHAESATRANFGSIVDIDLLGPAIDVAHAEVGGDSIVSARLDQRRAVVIEIGSDDGRLSVRPARDDAAIRTFVFTNTPLSTVVGALGSRTVAAAAVLPDGRFRVMRAQDLTGSDPEEITLTQAELPPLENLTGDPAVTSAFGAAVVLLPYGPDTAVQAILTTDQLPRVVALSDLSCSSIAVPGASGEGPQSALPVACATGGKIVDATVRVAEPR